MFNTFNTDDMLQQCRSCAPTLYLQSQEEPPVFLGTSPKRSYWDLGNPQSRRPNYTESEWKKIKHRRLRKRIAKQSRRINWRGK